MEQVLQDDHLCYVLLNFAGERDEPRARCLSKHWRRLGRRWIASLPSNVTLRTAVFSPDGAIIAVAGGTYNYGAFAICDVRSGTKQFEIIRAKRIVSVAFLRDGGIVALQCLENVLPLYDTRTGSLLQEVALPDTSGKYAFAVSRDGAMLAVGRVGTTSGHETVSIYDAATFERRQAVEYDVPHSAAFSPDGATIAVGAFPKKLSLYDVATGAVVCEHDPTTTLFAMAFSPDGQVLAAGGDSYQTDDESDNDGPVVARPVPALTLYTEAGRVRGPDIDCGFTGNHLAFAPDNSVLAVCGRSDISWCYIFALYDVNTLKVRRTLQRQPEDQLDNGGCAIAFSPDSSKIAVGLKKVALYDTETGDPIRVP